MKKYRNYWLLAVAISVFFIASSSLFIIDSYNEALQIQQLDLTSP